MQRVVAMQRGAMLYKYNQGKPKRLGFMGKSEAAGPASAPRRRHSAAALTSWQRHSAAALTSRQHHSAAALASRQRHSTVALASWQRHSAAALAPWQGAH